MTRRTVLAAAAASAAGATLSSPARAQPTTGATPTLDRRIAELEQRHDVRIGLYAKALNGGREIAWRADERFLMLSVFKAYAAAAVADQRLITPDRHVLERRVHLPPTAVAEGPTWFADHIANGYAPTVAEVCEATVQLSDSTAGNHLMSLMGGTAALNRFARACGDRATRLTEWEPELNRPGSDNNTSPRGVGTGFARMLTGDVLGRPARRRITEWMLGNTTSKERFRAGLPKGWRLADKTGSGEDASANDVGVAWSPDGRAYLLSMLTSSTRLDTEREQRIFADVARWSLEILQDR
ncbi:MAG: class A beta-lactamase [Propionibacteriales bacterium]|nr:class A beta-lactamase [Propionibacteriales bacterium]